MMKTDYLISVKNVSPGPSHPPAPGALERIQGGSIWRELCYLPQGVVMTNSLKRVIRFKCVSQYLASSRWLDSWMVG